MLITIETSVLFTGKVGNCMLYDNKVSIANKKLNHATNEYCSEINMFGVEFATQLINV
jgi:hypothetical protein